jgi:uncharacterized tellurite resistance protein B-like protein
MMIMGFFDFFTNDDSQNIKKYNDLYDKFSKEYPDIAEKELVLTSCIAGLLARVAYIDFSLHENEKTEIQKVISNWNFHSDLDSKVVARIAIEHIKEMAGLDNHLFYAPLKNYMTKEDRFEVLKSLFLVAASDGSVDGVESEEIKGICKGLELSTQHFLVARANVVEFLKALK